MRRIVVICFLLLSGAAFAGLCPKCNEQVYGSDTFCASCGAKLEWNAKEESGGFFSSIGNSLAGMGRGVVTVALSPLNGLRAGVMMACFFGKSRGPGTEDVSLFRSLLGLPLGTYLFGGPFTFVDGVNGTLDIMSAGFYGDWLYDSKEPGKPTPWIWERSWDSMFDGGNPFLGRRR